MSRENVRPIESRLLNDRRASRLPFPVGEIAAPSLHRFFELNVGFSQLIELAFGNVVKAWKYC